MEAKACIYDAIRTPRGRGKKNGALYEVPPIDLVAGLLHALEDRNNLDTAQVEDMFLGCVTPIGDQGADIARTANKGVEARRCSMDLWAPSARPSP